MLPYQNHTILDESIENALAFCSRVILVSGHRSDELVSRYRSEKGVDVIVNTHFKKGMFSSIQQGVKLVETEHFYICHADMPCITEDIYREIWALRGPHTVFPGTVNRPGHPVLLPLSLREQIMSAPLNSKMKQLIYRSEVKFAGLDTEKIYFDVDTPEAYNELCQGYKYHYQNES